MKKIEITKFGEIEPKLVRRVRPILMKVSVGMTAVLLSLSSTEIKDFTGITKTQTYGQSQLRSLKSESSDIKITRRVCPKCGDDKLLSEFYKNKSKSDGHESHCKVCVLNKKKRKPKLLGGAIEIEVAMKRSNDFIPALDLILDVVCIEVTRNA
jgi:ribosomal protein S27AE